ncbi:MAG: hypothetical protein QXO27_04520 [Candidatus Aenigmatarchaeota archaeon]
MRWRFFLALIIIMGIIGLVIYSGLGKGLLGLKSGEFAKTKESQQSFFIVLSAEKESFYGQIYNVANSTFIGSGLCQPIKLNELTLKKESTCDITMGDYSGVFEYSSIGSVKLIGQTNNLIIDGSTYSSPQPINILLEIVPSSFAIGGISGDKISMSSVVGEVKRLENDIVKSISYLKGELLNIDNFVGEIKLENGLVTLSGMTNSVKGNSFSW